MRRIHQREKRVVQPFIWALLVIGLMIKPLLATAQYEGVWRNATTEYNVPDFTVNAGQVTNFHASLRYLCGSYYYADSYSLSSASIVDGKFTVSLGDAYASYTFTGYFISSSICTGRYSCFASRGGYYSISSGSWRTTKVSSDPIISVTPASRDFGTLLIGTATTRTFIVQNMGGGTLSGSVGGLSTPFAVEGGTSYTLNSFASTSITVRFAPVALGVYTQTLVFTGAAGASRQVTGACANPNEAPTNILLSNTNISENLPAGSLIGSFWAQDLNPGNTFTYSLVSGTGSADNGSFSISGSNLLTAATFNYEVKSNYSIRVQAMDQGGLSTQKMFTIQVLDINEQPTFACPAVQNSSNLVLCWNSVTNHQYTIMYSTNLMNGFTALQSGLAATPPMNCVTVSVQNISQRFWMISTTP